MMSNRRGSRTMLNHYDATGVPPAEVFRRWREEKEKAYA